MLTENPVDGLKLHVSAELSSSHYNLDFSEIN